MSRGSGAERFVAIMMDETKKRRPGADEYVEYYAGYVSRVPDGDIIDILRRQLDSGLDVLEGFSREKSEYRYAPDKWSVKEVLGHVIDVEWIFTYRALRIARGDKTPLAGMEQDEFMAGANFADRDIAGMLEEYRHLRMANVKLFESFDEEMLLRRGTASGCEFSVRALLYIIAGHSSHHMSVLKEKYF